MLISKFISNQMPGFLKLPLSGKLVCVFVCVFVCVCVCVCVCVSMSQAMKTIHVK